MAFEKVSTILKMVDEADTAALAFDCVDYNTVYPVIRAAEQLKKPVIVMLYPEHQYLNQLTSLGTFAGMVKELAEKAKVPVGLHLDHCSDYEYILQAIKAGFTSVMIDGSMLPFEENITITSKVTETAHALGVDVEAELGHVGIAARGDGEVKDLYTQPHAAAEFCARTGADSIAVAIGSAHGVYMTEPKLDLKRLEEINEAVKVPLVLHGGSGIPNEQMAQAFRKGINKLNVGTEYFQLYHDTICDYTKKEGAGGSLFDIGTYTQKALYEYLLKKMQLCQFECK
ncbi:class II fructose-bisphosphate aldolase [Blautia schinkii]|nr:class II fructose-bisphosphate aldolase [Blautia schinkii]